MDNEVLRQNGKPIFLSISPPVMIRNIQQTVEVGTHVTFLVSGDVFQYSRIIKSFINSSNEVSVTVNRYMTRSELHEDFGSEVLLPSPLTNRLISVPEIFQTSVFIDVRVQQLHNINFIFKPAKILEDGYKGSENMFAWGFTSMSRKYAPISKMKWFILSCVVIVSQTSLLSTKVRHTR